MMLRRTFAALCTFAPAALGTWLIVTANAADVSFRNELQLSIDRGLRFLESAQSSNGWWSTPDQPAVTALALSAFLGEPTRRYQTNPPPFIERGFKHLLDSVQPDGSIQRQGMANYNTAISMMALLLAERPEYEPVIRRARQFVVKSQIDQGEPGRVDTPFDGGVGYGSKYDHSDMNNTLVALEALYYSRRLVADRVETTNELNWAAALAFLQNCQNLPSHNKQPWASGDSTNKGGFIYYPGVSMAGGETNPVTGKVTLRSYGSISYAGLLSYVYAQLDRNDPRVGAVLDWLQSNYTLEENPGMGAQGLYYYLHLMTKALHTAGVEKLQLRNGQQVNWRREAALRLLALQKNDGSWSNDHPRWWEKDPALVTSYSVMSLEMLWRGL